MTAQAEPRESTHFERERGVTEIEVMRGVVHVSVHVPEDTSNKRRVLLRRFADANLPVFLVKLLPHGVSFALRSGQAEEGTALLSDLATAEGLEVQRQADLGLVTTRAGAMRDLSGVMATIYDVLTHEGVRVQQTGDTYNAVHCLVSGADADRAADALRKRFGMAGAAE